ncbi:MAG: hypothetical protein ACPLIG_01020 [Candidatus Bathyarchaeales archaeon]
MDMAKYEAKLVSKMDFPVDANGFSRSTMLYNLKAQGSTLEVICNFRNSTLVSCDVNTLEGAPLLSQPITNVLDSAKDFLERYQNYSKASYVQSLRAMLNMVSELTPMTVVSGDLKLTITTEDYVYIEWMNAPNGIHNMYNRVILAFQNGAFKMFTDSWNRYPIGSSDVSISKEQAISIAKEHAKFFSYEVGNMTISNMVILDKPEFIRAELTMQPRENALYPYWEVILPLEKLYPGMTTAIRVTLWADTGQVLSIQATGSLGSPLSNGLPTSASSPTPSANTQTSVVNEPTSLVNIPLIAGVALAITIAVAVVAITIKKGANRRRSLFIFHLFAQVLIRLNKIALKIIKRHSRIIS